MKKHQCEKCGKHLTCPRCTGAQGGGKTGPTKSRPSDKMRQAALVGWHNRRTKVRADHESAELPSMQQANKDGAK